jgi:O-antigen/teichoic acid export membrane protein
MLNKKETSLTKKTFQGFFWSASGKMINAVSQIIVLVVLARLISPKSFGIVQAALIVVGFAKVFSHMGIGPAIVQRKNLTEKHIRTGFATSLGIGLFLASIIFFGAEYIASFFRSEELPSVLRVISFLFITEAFTTVSGSLIQRDMRFKEQAIVEMSSYILGYGLFGVVFGYLGLDYWALVIAVFAQEGIRVVSYTILQKHSLIPVWSKKEFKELIYFGGGQTLAVIFNKLGMQGDNLITGRYLGEKALGLYSRAYGLMVQPYSLLADAIDNTLYPAMCSVQDDKTRLLRSFQKSTKALAILCLPIMAVFLLLSENIILLLLGNNWIEAAAPLAILSLTFLFRVASRISDILVRATGEVYKRAWRRFIYAVLILSGTYIGQLYAGLIGVAWGVVFASFINFILMGSLTFRILNIGWKEYLGFYKEGIIILLIFGSMLLISKLIVSYITSVSVLVLFGSGILGCVLSTPIFLKYKSFFFGDVKEYLLPVLNKFKLSSLLKKLRLIK